MNYFLSQDGVPVDKPSIKNQTYFFRDPQGAWYPTNCNLIYEIDALCVQVHDALAAKLFAGLDNYYSFLRQAPEFLLTAGLNSESLISKDVFGRLVGKLEDDKEINRALYLYDCRKLASGIQECSKEVMQLQGEFYRILNLDELFIGSIDEPDGVRYVTSPAVTNLHAILSFIYIRLHSLLDYATKLSIEIENLKSDFSSYPRLTSKNSLYSDRKKVSFNGEEGTLFEQCRLLTEVEGVRNHVIHDGMLDDMPKAYKVISGGKCLEKFILFPDCSSEGRFAAFKNRTLFYSKEDKVNLRLPTVIREFQQRELITLQRLLTHLEAGDIMPPPAAGSSNG